MFQPHQEVSLNLKVGFNLMIPECVTNITTLKFINQKFTSYEDIKVKVKVQNDKQQQIEQISYAKILSIVKLEDMRFPVLKVMWYYTKEDSILRDLGYSHISKRELVVSKDTDWIYSESILSKIIITTIDQYKMMDECQKDDNKLFFCRSYLTYNEAIGYKLKGITTSQCDCRRPYNPDVQNLVICPICRVKHHLCCSRGEEMCIHCQVQ